MHRCRCNIKICEIHMGGADVDTYNFKFNRSENTPSWGPVSAPTLTYTDTNRL